jgi:hypothetical protein
MRSTLMTPPRRNAALQSKKRAPFGAGVADPRTGRGHNELKENDRPQAGLESATDLKDRSIATTFSSET